jgi:hypothetical protein
MKTLREKALEAIVIDLENQLSHVQHKYDALVGVLKRDANTKRNVDDGDAFLTSYGSRGHGFWE